MLRSRYKLFSYNLTIECIRRCSKTCAAASTKMKPEKSKNEETPAPRMNSVGVQMLSESLYSQIFGQPKLENQIQHRDRVNQSIDHLKQHELWGKPTDLLPDVKFKIPKLRGRNLDEHFRAIASEQTEQYRQLILKLSANNLPRLPKKWNFQPGWTKYSSTGQMEIVNFPEDEALVFDVEVCVTEGQLPTLATAASHNAWYSWCSPKLTENQLTHSEKTSSDDLIPLETECGQVAPPDGKWKKRIVVGHNVSYDRAKVKEQYYLKESNTRFLDTMSLHIAVSGMTTFQRSLKAATKTNSKRKDIQEAKSKLSGPEVEEWLEITSGNGLIDVHQLYCGGERLDKDARNTFVKGSMNDIRDNFQPLMTYCSKDVIATHAVLRAVLPLFYERFPHPVTLAGMLEMSVAYLPVNENWQKYLKNAQTSYDQLQREVKLTLMHLADEACQLSHEEKYKKDSWLYDLDWTVKKLRIKKNSKIEPNTLPEWYRKLCSKKEENWPPGKPVISTQMRIAPKLLRLTWNGFPLYYDDTHGWGYLVPKNSTECSESEFGDDDECGDDDDGNFLLLFILLYIFNFYNFLKVQIFFRENAANIEKLWAQLERGIGDPVELSELFLNAVRNVPKREKWQKPLRFPAIEPDIEVEINGCKFHRLPHKDGPKNRVGNPLAKDFLNKIENGTLKAKAGAKAERILRIGKMTSYWKNAQKRICSQLVVWLKKNELTKLTTQNSDYNEENSYGAILPQLVTAGTLTRRAVEPTWLTASNAYPDRVGSELKSMVQAPPGYRFVGADVDSQEIWIAATLGDSNFAGFHGCTASGWMVLQGRKSDGTDVHSRTAKTVGISRDHAKVMNYGRIYGAGQPFAKQLLQQFNHKLSLAEAENKARKMFAATKGKKGYLLNETGIQLYNKWKGSERSSEIDNPCLTSGEIQKMLRKTNRFLRLRDVADRSVWVGGTESAMFNQLEEIAHSREPRTPILGCRISRSLEPGVVGDNFMTSRINWVVQSSAVDYLHLMLVSMRWLCSLYGIDARFSISIHDEVRYLVKEEDRYRASLALQITNLLTRAMFAEKLGMHDLPQSVAFFSAIDVDTVLRKEVTMDCKTPSNPLGLTKGYGIASGEALNIYQILDKTNGNLEINNCINKT
uniref:DNA polymerase subunit gamma-1 n=1 Tax=Strigamia maritima TaxID=126957 RepID=T1IPA4_STRMM